MLRLMVFFNSASNLEQAIQILDQRFTILEIKNRIHDPKFAYDAIFVIFDYQGILTEV